MEAYSPFFQIHVLGNFPPMDKDTLIPLGWIERSMADKTEGHGARMPDLMLQGWEATTQSL